MEYKGLTLLINLLGEYGLTVEKTENNKNNAGKSPVLVLYNLISEWETKKNANT